MSNSGFPHVSRDQDDRASAAASSTDQSDLVANETRANEMRVGGSSC
jgi:hypothetical protein